MTSERSNIEMKIKADTNKGRILFGLASLSVRVGFGFDYRSI